MGLTVSQKVDDYAKSHVKELREVEKKNGHPMTKDDVVEYMMKKGELTQGDYNIWYSSTEGSNSRMNKLGRTSSVWTQTNSAIGGETQKSYLDDFKEASCIPDLGDTYKKSVDRATKSKNSTISVKRNLEKQKFQDYLNSLPPVTASYTDLMRSIKFEKASPSERIDMMLQQAGERFQVAREQGDTNQMGKLLLDGLMLSFQKIDSELGITYVKEGMKNANIVKVIEQAVSAMVDDGDNSNTTSMEKFWNSIKESDAFQAVKSCGGFNDIISQIDKLVDDGDPNNLGILEKSWDGLKGVGQFADNFVGTQGVVVLAAYALIMQAAVAGGGAIGSAVVGGEAGATMGSAVASEIIGGGFVAAGGYHTIDGAIDFYNAETHEEAQAAGAKIAQGALEIYGGYRGLKAGIAMYKAGKFQQMQTLEQENALAEARKLFGFEDGVEITEASLKAARNKAVLKLHPDKSGTNDICAEINAAYDLLKDNIVADNNLNVAKSASQTPAAEPAPQNTPAQAKTGATSPSTEISDAQFAIKLAQYKDANGRQILSPDDITYLLRNKTGYYGPIKNFQAKVEAVLSNPEEVANIIRYNDRSSGVWETIQTPLKSTVNANPELFGGKPKAAPTTTQPKGAVPTTNISELAKTPEGVAPLEKQPEIKLAGGKDANGKPILKHEAGHAPEKPQRTAPTTLAKVKGVLTGKSKAEVFETEFRKNLAKKVSSPEIKSLLLSKTGKEITNYGNNLIEEIKLFEESIEAAQKDFEREDIKQALIDTAAELYGKVYSNANRPNYYSKHFADAQSIKEALLEKRGIKIHVEYDGYYGRTIERIYYTYNGREFDLSTKSKYDETLNELINASFSGNKDGVHVAKKANKDAANPKTQLTEVVKTKQNPSAKPKAAPTTQASPAAIWTEYMEANPELFGGKPKATPTVQNTQTSLIDNSRKPANLNPAVEQELNDYATQNNYELKYSKTGNAVFRNNDGKIVRRVDIDENGNLRNDRYFIARNESTITGKKIASGTPIKNSLAKCKIPSKMQYTTGNIGNVTVNVALGDMTAIKADAFVVPEFQTRVSEGGVGGAIWSKGAGKGMEAYEKHIKKHGKQEFGSVVVTDAGGGNSSKLLHAVTVGSGAENEFTTIQTAVYNALRTAQEQGMQSVVIPQMGTGIIGSLTSEQSAGAIMSGINQFNADGGKMDVSVVIYGSQNAYNTFTNSLQNHSYTEAQPEVGTKEFNIAEFAKEMSQESPRVNAQLRSEILHAAKNASYDATVVERLLNSHPEIAEQLAQIKGSDGNALFSAPDISDIFYNCSKTVENNPDAILEIFDDPSNISKIELFKNKSAVIYWMLYH